VISLLMRGGLAGIIATVVMSLVIFGGRAIGLLHTPPPRQITGKVVRTARTDQDLPAEVSGPVFEATWLASHLGYGAACGALYTHVRLLLPAPAAAAGLAYGLVVWGLSYMKTGCPRPGARRGEPFRRSCRDGAMNVMRLWWLSLGIFAAVVGVVAGLLGLIIAAARSIDRHAEAIWVAGKQIAGNTVSIWMLEKTNEQLADMLEATRALERTAASIDAKLQALAGAAGEKS
jgi:hypothetical protein